MIINNKRALAYVEKIAWVKPIEGADNIELIGINGWTCIAKKGEFKENDLCVYFEIDSKLPVTDWSAFMESKGYKVKTMKLNKFKVISQGLALPFSAFGAEYKIPPIIHSDLTDTLKVTYSVEEDNKRKADSEDKYKRMAQRKPKFFANPLIKKIMKYKIGRNIMFFFFGKKRDKKTAWPDWVKKTDEERIENMPWILENSKQLWIPTEKIDGTSTTFTMKRTAMGKMDYRVCSRNVVFDKPNKACYYDTNVYLEMGEKYKIEDVLRNILARRKDVKYVTLQGETYGAGIQKRDYGMKDHDFAAFNLIYGYKNGEVYRFNPPEMQAILKPLGVPCVPILFYSGMTLPATIEELRTYVNGTKSIIDNGMREGVVFRSIDGKSSFKCVSPEFILKYHS